MILFTDSTESKHNVIENIGNFKETDASYLNTINDQLQQTNILSDFNKKIAANKIYFLPLFLQH